MQQHIVRASRLRVGLLICLFTVGFLQIVEVCGHVKKRPTFKKKRPVKETCIHEKAECRYLIGLFTVCFLQKHFHEYRSLLQVSFF